MSDFSATDVAFTGFRFVRERPRAAAAWAAVQLVLGGLASLIMIGVAGPSMMQMQALRGKTPADPTAALGQLGRVLPAELLTMVVALVLYALLNAAAARAMLRTDDRRLGYLRFGADELRQFLLLLLTCAIVFGAMIGASVVIGILMAFLGVAAKAFAGLAAMVLTFACGCAALYCWVRLSLAAPLTFDEGRVDLFGSWALTRGRFWKMFGTYVLVLALGVLVALLVLMISAAVAAVAGGGLEGAGQLFHPDMSSLAAYFTPVRIVLLLVNTLASALILPLFLTPAPELYRQLRTQDVF